MNRDLEQIKLFLDSSIEHSINTYKWVEGKGANPEKAYLEITAKGKKEGIVSDLSILKKLLNAKANRDLHKKMWTEDLREGRLSAEELVEDGYESIAQDCMKDIIKTSSRSLDGRDHRISFGNRNWYMLKLNIKLPNDSHDAACMMCQEEFWTHKAYVRKEC